MRIYKKEILLNMMGAHIMLAIQMEKELYLCTKKEHTPIGWFEKKMFKLFKKGDRK